MQPGWPDGGNAAVISWSVEPDHDDFVDAIGGVRRLGGPILHPEPSWVGYWSFPTKDPMGNTVELTYPQTPTPESVEWSIGR